MKATLVDYYRTKGSEGTPSKIMFRFKVSGTDEELAAYKKAKEDSEDPRDKVLWDDDGETIIMLNRSAHGLKRGESMDLLITKNHKVVFDDIEQVIESEEFMENLVARERAKMRVRIETFGKLKMIQDSEDESF